jgi:hypothetical protein
MFNPTAIRSDEDLKLNYEYIINNCYPIDVIMHYPYMPYMKQIGICLDLSKHICITFPNQKLSYVGRLVERFIEYQSYSDCNMIVIHTESGSESYGRNIVQHNPLCELITSISHTEETLRLIQDSFTSVEWNYLVMMYKLSEEYIRVNRSHMSWFLIMSTQTLSDEFINEFKYEIGHKLLAKFCNKQIEYFEEYFNIDEVINDIAEYIFIPQRLFGKIDLSKNCNILRNQKLTKLYVDEIIMLNGLYPS